MKQNQSKYPRILALTPSARGFGFALFEGPGTLADWGRREVKGNHKNKAALPKVEELIAHCQPDILVLEDTLAESSRRAPRIRKLSQRIIELAAKRRVKVALFSRKEVLNNFFADGKGSKDETAKIIAERFPDDLGFQLPPKRPQWESEDPRMDIFDAVALAMVFRKGKQ